MLKMSDEEFKKERYLYSLGGTHDVYFKILEITDGKNTLDCLCALSTVIQSLVNKVPQKNFDIVLKSILTIISRDIKTQIEEIEKEKQAVYDSLTKIQESSDDYKKKIFQLAKVMGKSEEDIISCLIEEVYKLNLSEEIKSKLISNIKEDFGFVQN